MPRLLHRLLLSASVLAVACASPTLPLPPPEGEAAAPTEAGLVKVTGNANDDAFVACLNLRTEEGVIVRADRMGRFELTLEGRSGDDLELWQIIGSDTGEHDYITVPEPE